MEERFSKMGHIEYTIKRSARARRVSIGVHHTGEVVVTLPIKASEARAEFFVKTKARWIEHARERMRKRFADKVPLKQTRTDYKELKSKSLAFIKERIKHFNQHYHFPFKRIAIRMQASRWGSCSAKGNLNFNYSLVKLPQELADYIIVHELCHLKELNHGPRFWRLVAETIPDHRARRQALKKWIRIS